MLKCEKCKREYPSEYFFKTDTIYVECFNKLTPEDRKQAKTKLQHVPTLILLSSVFDGTDV